MKAIRTNKTIGAYLRTLIEIRSMHTIISNTYYVVLILFAAYSYVLIDPNLTLINQPWWSHIHEQLLQLGYYQRDTSWNYYLTLSILLFMFHIYFLSHYRRHNIFVLAGIVGTILLFAYPFLSRDFFNYIFDAKIATYYHLNPYTHSPSDFQEDHWLRFMHWTHRTYPYGPTFLLVSLIPSTLGMGKFILHYVLFKLMFVVCYWVGIYYLHKSNKYYAAFFATHPLILLEGIINSHNDLMAVALGIMGVYYVSHTTSIWGHILLALSGSIKYLTLPVITIRKQWQWSFIALIGQIALITYLVVDREIQPWYFLNLFIFTAIYPTFLVRLLPFFFGLFMSYYPYVRFGGWDETQQWPTLAKIALKHEIIWYGFIVSLIYFLGMYLYNKRGKMLPTN